MHGHLWTYADLCERLGIRPGTAYAWVCQGRIPFIRFSNRFVRFDPERIEAWLREREQEPTAASKPGSGTSGSTSVRDRCNSD